MRDKNILNNLGLIVKVMQDLNCDLSNQDNFEEYYFAGLLGLMKASETYDSTKGKSGYLYKAIRGRIISVFRKNTSSKRSPYKNISLNEVINDKGEELIDLIQDDYSFEQKLINKDYIHYLLNKLKNKRYKTFLLEYYGIGTEQLNLSEIALKYGVSKQFVYHSIKYALQRLKKIIKEKI